MAYPVSSFFASMVPAAPMMAETPQIPTPTERRLPSFSGQPEKPGEEADKDYRKEDLHDDDGKADAAQPGNIRDQESRPHQHDADLEEELVRADPRAKMRGSGMRLPRSIPPTMAMMTFDARERTQATVMAA